MAFSNGTDTQLSARAFTLVYVLDFEHTGTSENNDQVLLQIYGDSSAVGGYNAGEFRSMVLQVDKEHVFDARISRFEFILTKNDGSVVSLTSGTDVGVNCKRDQDDLDEETGWDEWYGKIVNFDFITGLVKVKDEDTDEEFFTKIGDLFAA